MTIVTFCVLPQNRCGVVQGVQNVDAGFIEDEVGVSLLALVDVFEQHFHRRCISEKSSTLFDICVRARIVSHATNLHHHLIVSLLIGDIK
jgi:hypothetical protein